MGPLPFAPSYAAAPTAPAPPLHCMIFLLISIASNFYVEYTAVPPRMNVEADQEQLMKDVLLKVMSLTQAELDSLPPDQRDSMLMLVRCCAALLGV